MGEWYKKAFLSAASLVVIASHGAEAVVDQRKIEEELNHDDIVAALEVEPPVNTAMEGLENGAELAAGGDIKKAQEEAEEVSETLKEAEKNQAEYREPPKEPSEEPKKEGLEGKVHSVEKEELDDNVKNTFEGGQYETVVTDEPVTLYRAHGENADGEGSYWTTEKPTDRMETKMDSALLQEWGNSRQYVDTMTVPEGTKLNVGTVAEQTSSTGQTLPGGGTQVLLDKDYFEKNPEAERTTEELGYASNYKEFDEKAAQIEKEAEEEKKQQALSEEKTKNERQEIEKENANENVKETPKKEQETEPWLKKDADGQIPAAEKKEETNGEEAYYKKQPDKEEDVKQENEKESSQKSENEEKRTVPEPEKEEKKTAPEPKKQEQETSPEPEESKAAPPPSEEEGIER